MKRLAWLVLITACGNPAALDREHLFGLYSIRNFADDHCRSVVHFTFSSRDTTLSGFGQLLPNDSIVERVYMGRYALHLLVEVYNTSYVFAYSDTVTDSIDVPGTRTLTHCLLGIPGGSL